MAEAGATSRPRATRYVRLFQICQFDEIKFWIASYIGCRMFLYVHHTERNQMSDKNAHAMPSDYWDLTIGAAMLAWNAQTVITLRTLGTFGLWPVKSTESSLMWTEKPPVFADSAMAAFTAASTGMRPDQIAKAAMAPLLKKTEANVKRLSSNR